MTAEQLTVHIWNESEVTDDNNRNMYYRNSSNIISGTNGLEKLMARAKKNLKLERLLPDIAQSFASRFIASFGITDAERIALLVLEKIRASRKSLERRYNE